ncbi:unnamed protein product, partial [Ranitomeya imitator]
MRPPFWKMAAPKEKTDGQTPGGAVIKTAIEVPRKQAQKGASDGRDTAVNQHNVSSDVPLTAEEEPLCRRHRKQQHGRQDRDLVKVLHTNYSGVISFSVTMSQAVQTNGAQPLSKTWELSLYELQRTPQEAITDGLEIVVSPRSLHSELMCPICLDMLKNTMTTKECLHRFCADCIITALRS